MGTFIYRSAGELARLIREGEATSVEIVKEHLDQIQAHNHRLQALVRIFEEEALSTAAERDKEVKAGNIRGPLHGVPLTIKEQFWIKGQKSTINSNLFKDFVASSDGLLIRRIRESGAILLGKTNVPKMLLDYQVNGDLYPEGKNPYDPTFTPGGSTGGGAAAVASGMTPLELGSDFGGSIRLPSHFSGVFGLKPTDRTVPNHGEMPAPKEPKTFIVHMAQPGPLARNVEDLELLWNVIKGPDPMDRSIPRIHWHTSEKQSLSEFRLAWTDQWPDFPASAAVSHTIQQLVKQISGTGAQLQRFQMEDDLHDETLRLYMGWAPYVIAQGMPWYIRKVLQWQFKSTMLKGWKRHVKEFDRAMHMNANHFGNMLLLKARLTERWERLFDDFDILICPAAFGPAFPRTKMGTPITYKDQTVSYVGYVIPFQVCFNASGHPAMSIPLGLNQEGLPIGIQIVGPYWSEPELLRFAQLLTKEIGGFVKPPLS